MNELLVSAGIFVSIMWFSEKALITMYDTSLPMIDIALITATVALIHVPGSYSQQCSAIDSRDAVWATFVLLAAEIVKMQRMYAPRADCFSVVIVICHLLAVLRSRKAETGCDQFQISAAVFLLLCTAYELRRSGDYPKSKSPQTKSLLY